jgi:hypothetical protein
MSIAMPEIFLPLKHSDRLVSAGNRYRNLSKYSLSVLEKNWLCREVDQNNIQTLDSWLDRVFTKTALIARSQLSKQFFRRNYETWKAICPSGNLYQHSLSSSQTTRHINRGSCLYNFRASQHRACHRGAKESSTHDLVLHDYRSAHRLHD